MFDFLQGSGLWIVTALLFSFVLFTSGPSNNSDLEITGFSFSAIPEPSSLLIALGGLGTLLLRRRRD